MLDLYKVGKLMYDLRNPERVAEWKRDPEAMMTKYGLPEEDKAVIRGKIAKPYFEAGMHPILLGTGARAMGLEGMMRFGMGQPANAGPDLEERKKKAQEIATMFNLVQAPAPQMASSGPAPANR